LKDDKGARKSFYRRGKYPFVLVNCYRKKGRLWGKSDTEQLIPIQDMINDMDDQIRMNARLVGNIQTVVGIASGINVKKWTNKPGLKIPAKDHTAFKEVQPAPMPAYIPQRREAGFRESEIVSGRSDVLEGRRSGSLRAASAILALQEAGSRRANHKKLMLQQSFIEIIDMVLDYVKEFMTEEQAFDITENDQVDYLWYRGSDLNEIPYLTLNENWDPNDETLMTSRYRPLTETVEDELTGMTTEEMITKEAEFDIDISLGAGMPNNKSFLYQAIVELNSEGLITREEGRETLKKVLNWPVIDPFNPVGTFNGRNLSPEQLAAANGTLPPDQSQGQAPGMTEEQYVDPAEQQMMIQQVLQSIPPEMLQEILGKVEGGVM
jgi:hypothetical protein